MSLPKYVLIQSSTPTLWFSEKNHKKLNDQVKENQDQQFGGIKLRGILF